MCLLLLGPKPTTICCGLAAMGVGFFQIPYDKAAPIPKKVVAIARTTILEGELSAELVKLESERLIPVKWGWLVRPHTAGSYLVSFPCCRVSRLVVPRGEANKPTNHHYTKGQEWKGPAQGP